MCGACLLAAVSWIHHIDNRLQGIEQCAIAAAGSQFPGVSIGTGGGRDVDITDVEAEDQKRRQKEREEERAELQEGQEAAEEALAAGYEHLPGMPLPEEEQEGLEAEPQASERLERKPPIGSRPEGGLVRCRAAGCRRYARADQPSRTRAKRPGRGSGAGGQSGRAGGRGPRHRDQGQGSAWVRQSAGRLTDQAVVTRGPLAVFPEGLAGRT